MIGDYSRSPLVISISVWKALFLREAISRVSGTRTAWIWLLFEPVVHILFIMFVMEEIRFRVVGGIDTGMWLLVGMTTFFIFKRAALQSMNALHANQPLFIYRQVWPVDTVFVRAMIEGVFMSIVTILLFIAAFYLGEEVLPYNPLGSLSAYMGLWLVALGFGLITSVVGFMFADLENTIKMLITPLYLFSGVIFPLSRVPPPYQEWLMYNPLAHGIELARMSFSPFYKPVPGVSETYIYSFALVMIFLGLALHVRYAMRLRTQ